MGGDSSAQDCHIVLWNNATTPFILVFHCNDDPIMEATNASVFYGMMKDTGTKPRCISIPRAITAGV